VDSIVVVVVVVVMQEILSMMQNQLSAKAFLQNSDNGSIVSVFQCFGRKDCLSLRVIRNNNRGNGPKLLRSYYYFYLM
jgi:hypothetical protein